MRRAASLFLLLLLPVGGVRAQAAVTGTVLGLPDAPSAQHPDPPLRLRDADRPAWAVSRSHLGDKLRYGFGSMVSVRTLVEGVLIAGIPNIDSPPVQPVYTPGEDSGVYEHLMNIYGDQTSLWLRKQDTVVRKHGYRLEVGLSTAETRQLLSNLALPIALHQEARYHPAPIDATLGERLAHATESLVVTRSDSGRTVPNYSKLGGTVAAGLLGSMVYAPMVDGTTLNSGRFAIKYIGYSLAGDLATNVTHELLLAAIAPDMQMYQLHGRAMEDSYYPRSVGGKILDWAHASYGLRAFVSAGFLGGIPAIHDEPTEPRRGNPSTFNGYPDYNTAYDHWGEAELAWKDELQENVRLHGRRLAGGLAETESQLLLEKLVIPIGLGIDARYIPLGSGHDAGQRFSHAFQSLFVARTDSGGRTVNLPVLVGTAGAAFAAKELYYPQLGTPALETNTVLAGTIGFNLLADLLGNLHSEFMRHYRYW